MQNTVKTVDIVVGFRGPLQNHMVRSLLLTIFASFVTCDVFTAQMESGDLKKTVT